MATWNVTVRTRQSAIKILVTDDLGDEVLRARLPRRLGVHPRALLTMLEGIALWSGAPVSAAISADDAAHGHSESSLFGGVLWPAESALVRFDIVEGRRPYRLRGLGDFRDVLAVHTKQIP